LMQFLDSRTLASVIHFTAGIEFSKDVVAKIQQRGRIIRRPARCEWCNALKAELGEIQPVDKHIDRPHWIVLAQILVQHRAVRLLQG
jgi:hypothetical protein